MVASRRLLCAVSLAVLSLGLSLGSARAAPSSAFSVVVSPVANLGSVVGATTGSTTFRIDDTAPVVSVITGQGYRPSSSSGDARARVTVTCVNTDPDCSKTLTVTITPVNQTTGRGQALSAFTVNMLTGRIVSGTGTAGSAGPGAPLVFTLQALGPHGSAQFYVGMDFPIAGGESGKANGTASATYSITAAASPTDSTSNVTLAQAYVNRPLGLSSSGALNFGSLIKPALSGTAQIDPATGAEQLTNLSALPNSTASRVLFNATGEPSKQVSITVPPNFALNRTGGGGTITATLSSSAPAAVSLSMGGAYAFGVGGSISLSNSTPTGAYTGTFAVSIAYN